MLKVHQNLVGCHYNHTRRVNSLNNHACSLTNTCINKLVGNNFIGIRSRVRSKCCAQELDLVSVPTPVGLVTSYTSDISDFYKVEYEMQSEVISDAHGEKTGEETKQEIVTYLEDQQSLHIGSSTDPSFGDFTTDTHIQKFFARPVRTVSFTWLEADPIGAKTNYAIWNDWVTNPYIKNKMNNYSFMRGDLNVKIQISASPFYYGLLQASYRPLPNFKADTIVVDAGNRWLIPLSQRPKVNINPQTGDTYTMTLPFIWPLNMINAQLSTSFQDLGQLRFDIYSQLASANGAVGTGITVTVYCWMENIILSGASAGYAAQSDEYGEGVVSRPATWISSIAGRLENLPIIGKFATATRIGAAVSAIASMFGFTNVPVISDTMPLHGEPFPKFASTEIGFPVQKLTLDPKNELSIDPTIIGLPDGKDEMIMRSLCARESFLARTTWTTASTVDTILFSAFVNPVLCDNDGAAQTKLYMTPMAWVSNMFKYWRGDIIFTFRVICSKYHKGKLRIGYDPTGLTNPLYNIFDNADTTNTVHTTILDIGESTEIEMTIPYQQAKQFLVCNTIEAKTWSTSSAPTFVVNQDSYNGALVMRVQNSLTAPIASSSVDVLVYVRAGSNIEFADPDEIDSSHKYSYYAPQSDEYHDAQVDHESQIGAVKSSNPNQFLVHYGENIVSLRQLMRRYQIVSTERFSPTLVADTYRRATKTFLKVPPTNGYNTLSYQTANKIVGVGTYGYNFTNFTPMTYIPNAFLCYRGSVNWSFDVATTNPIKHLRVLKDTTNSSATAGFSVLDTVCATNSQMARASCFLAGASGVAVTNQLTQSGLNVQCPMFTNNKFMSTDPDRGTTGSSLDGSNLDTFRLVIDYPFPATVITEGVMVNSYVAAGTDYGLYFFLNVPTLYVYSAYPTAV
jgi:hypothetical protein